MHDAADTTREHVTATREHVTAPSDDATLPIVYQVRNMCRGRDVVALVLIFEYGTANHSITHEPKPLHRLDQALLAP